MRLSLARMLVAAHATLACGALAACATGTLPDEQLFTAAPPGDDAGAEGGSSPADDASAPSDSSVKGTPFDAPSDPTSTIVDSGGAVRPVAGEVVVSEVLYNPAGTEPNEEWFELYNTTGTSKLLNGLTLKDGGGRAYTIPASPLAIIQPSGYFLLVHTKSAALAVSLPGAALAFEYGAVAAGTDIQLTNSSAGAISVFNGATQIAQSPYGGWFTSTVTSGVSIELKTLTNAASLVKANWCLSTTAWPGGNGKGTPSAANDCP